MYIYIDFLRKHRLIGLFIGARDISKCRLFEAGGRWGLLFSVSLYQHIPYKP